MPASQNKRQNRVLGPRALAMISCALALLAAQPLVASPARPSIAIKVATFDAATAAAPTVFRTEQTAATKRPTQLTLLASARRLHILATVEILHRLIAQELSPNLQPRDFQFFASLNFVGELCPFESALAVPYRVHSAQSPEPPAERQFVQARCLLAPPLS